jgi:hypothetical protein
MKIWCLFATLMLTLLFNNPIIAYDLFSFKIQLPSTIEEENFPESSYSFDVKRRTDRDTGEIKFIVFMKSLKGSEVQKSNPISSARWDQLEKQDKCKLHDFLSEKYEMFQGRKNECDIFIKMASQSIEPGEYLNAKSFLVTELLGEALGINARMAEVTKLGCKTKTIEKNYIEAIVNNTLIGKPSIKDQKTLERLETGMCFWVDEKKRNKIFEKSYDKGFQ